MSATSPKRWTGQIAARPGRDRRLDPLGVDQVRVWLDVDEDGRRAGVQDRVGGRGERVRDGDHLVARLEADPGEDRHERERAVGHRHGMPDTAELRPLALQLGDLATLREHAAGEHLGDGRDLLGSDVRARDRDHAGAPSVMAGPRCSWSDALVADEGVMAAADGRSSARGRWRTARAWPGRGGRWRHAVADRRRRPSR